MKFLIPLCFCSAAGAVRPACAPLLWPAFTRVDVGREYPLRVGRLDPAAPSNSDRVVYPTPWGPSVWTRPEFAAWSALVTATARSGAGARARLRRLGRGERVAGLSDEAHRRVRAAAVIHQDSERHAAAVWLSRLVEYGFLPDASTPDVRAFTGTFGPRFTPDENARLGNPVRALLMNQAHLDVLQGEGPALRARMRADARALKIPYQDEHATLRAEDAIYLMRSLLREQLVRHLKLNVDDEVRFLLAFYPELFPVWPQLASWTMPVHDLDLGLGSSYFIAPDVRLTHEDFVSLQLRREPSEVERAPFREDVAAYLKITKDEKVRPVFYGYEEHEVDRMVERVRHEFALFAPRFGLDPRMLGRPHVNDFMSFLILSWPPHQVPSAVLIAFYAHLRETLVR